jgi:hypothetical protein
VLEMASFTTDRRGAAGIQASADPLISALNPQPQLARRRRGADLSRRPGR